MNTACSYFISTQSLEEQSETIKTLKNVVFWDAALCRSCVNRGFGGKYRLYLQGRKIRER
jgi:hypothetical protein